MAAGTPLEKTKKILTSTHSPPDVIPRDSRGREVHWNGLGLRLTATERVPLAQRTEGQTAPPPSPPSSPLCSAGTGGRREKDQEGAGVRGQEEGVLCGRRCRTAATAGAATAATVIAPPTAGAGEAAMEVVAGATAAGAGATAAGAGAAVRCTHSSIHPFSLPPAAATVAPSPPSLSLLL